MRRPLAMAPWMDGRVAVVAAHEQAAAELDRPAQLQGRQRGRLRAGHGDRGEVREIAPWRRPCSRATSSRTSASRVGARVELATSARPSGE